jgi:hypothetical protein
LFDKSTDVIFVEVAFKSSKFKLFDSIKDDIFVFETSRYEIFVLFEKSKEDKFGLLAQANLISTGSILVFTVENLFIEISMFFKSVLFERSILVILLKAIYKSVSFAHEFMLILLRELFTSPKYSKFDKLDDATNDFDDRFEKFDNDKNVIFVVGGRLTKDVEVDPDISTWYIELFEEKSQEIFLRDEILLFTIVILSKALQPVVVTFIKLDDFKSMPFNFTKPEKSQIVKLLE